MIHEIETDWIVLESNSVGQAMLRCAGLTVARIHVSLCSYIEIQEVAHTYEYDLLVPLSISFSFEFSFSRRKFYFGKQMNNFVLRNSAEIIPWTSEIYEPICIKGDP